MKRPFCLKLLIYQLAYQLWIFMTQTDFPLQIVSSLGVNFLSQSSWTPSIFCDMPREDFEFPPSSPEFPGAKVLLLMGWITIFAATNGGSNTICNHLLQTINIVIDMYIFILYIYIIYIYIIHIYILYTLYRWYSPTEASVISRDHSKTGGFTHQWPRWSDMRHGAIRWMICNGM